MVFKRMSEYERGYVDGHREGLETATRQSNQERETLIYWLLRCYESGHRQGWEEGPTTTETMERVCDVLANRGYDPKDESAKRLLREPRLRG